MNGIGLEAFPHPTTVMLRRRRYAYEVEHRPLVHQPQRHLYLGPLREVVMTTRTATAAALVLAQSVVVSSTRTIVVLATRALSCAPPPGGTMDVIGIEVG